MKKILFTIFRFLFIIILIAKISNWFFSYNDLTNKIINAAMFVLIGIAYLVVGFFWEKKIINIIFIACGGYLIIMNFMDNFILKSIIGILCILTPMLIARFSPKQTTKKARRKTNV
jgi:hypothetical protein